MKIKQLFDDVEEIEINSILKELKKIKEEESQLKKRKEILLRR